MRTFLRTLALLLAIAVPASAVEIAGVKLPDTASVGGQNLVLNGAALRTKFFIKVYAAGLYLPAKQKDAKAILAADSPRRMLMHFIYGVGPEKINEAWEEGLAANTPNASAELQGQFKQLTGWMEEVEEGDELAFTYVPGTGTEVVVKGKVKGTIPGKAFADALLACWIGAEPAPGADFKKGVLGAS